jgi:glycosyltransferase involved in cell wall biosynthesis
MWPFFFLSWLLPLFYFRYRPTHIVAQCPVIGGISSAICSIVFRVPLFLELHGAHYFYQTKEGWKGRLEYLCYRYMSVPGIIVASRIRSLSEDMSDHIKDVYGKSAYEKSCIIPNRVDLKVFRFIKTDYDYTGPLKLISVGSFFPRKNFLELIEDLCRTEIDLRLTLVGAGPLTDKYEALADELNFRERLEIVESVDHDTLAALLVDHDIYVHYALSEAVPRAILEAMAVALPVIATRVGFIKGIIADLDNAIVIDQPYKNGLESALKALTGSEELRRRLGTNARNDIEDRFEWGRVFDLYRSSILSMS